MNTWMDGMSTWMDGWDDHTGWDDTVGRGATDPC